MQDNLNGKKIIVTGASSGIGRETAIYLDTLGCSLILMGRNHDRLQETRELLQERDHKIFPTDFAEKKDLEYIFKDIVSDGVKLDGMVYCAGICPIVPIKLLKHEIIDQVMQVNVYAFIEMVRNFSNKKYYKENSSIVVISSIAAMRPEKCQTLYAMSKAALNTAVEALAIELASKKIRINSVMPGLTNTPMATRAGEFVSGDEFISSVEKKQLLGILEPRQISEIAAFLLSNLSSAITGRAIYADGGNL